MAFTKHLLFLVLIVSLVPLLAALPVTNGLVAHYQAEGNTGDSTGNHNGNNFGATFAPGNQGFGQAFQMDGSSYVDLGHSSDFQILDTMTISGWFQTNSNGSRQMIIQKGDQNSGGFEWVIEVGPTGFLSAHFEVGNSGSTVFAQNSDQVVNDGEFHHFAAVFFTNPVAEDLILYVDGVEQSTASGDQRSTLNYGTNNVSVSIGARNPFSSPALFFNGLIDDIAVFNRDLSEGEVQALFNVSAVPEPSTGLFFFVALSLFYMRKR